MRVASPAETSQLASALYAVHAVAAVVMALVLLGLQRVYRREFLAHWALSWLAMALQTGAILVALGKEHAGLFATDDKLAADLIAAGQATGERVWRMPLDRAYDKLLDSKNADMKNIGGRFGGAITAAQFLQRFIKEQATPWAHIDVAGTAMDSNRDDINQSWGSGWGVRLLDALVERHYE